jgi:glyoxylase-like metal-dependent hydrolase (beta-lactamase superfamily II)
MQTLAGTARRSSLGHPFVWGSPRVIIAGGGYAMNEIVRDVFTWPWFSEPHGYHFNGFLIRHPDGNLCLDPVEPSAEVLAELRRLGVARILLSNRNHVRAANRVREATGARTAIHPEDAEYARRQGAAIDDPLHAGTKIGPLVAVGAPGKSPGELAFHWPEQRILIVGDAVIGNPPGRCALLREKVMDDPPRLRESVETLLALDFDTLLFGDGEPILTGAKQRLQELVATFPA